MKKILSFLLCAVLLISASVPAVYAEDTGNAGYNIADDFDNIVKINSLVDYPITKTPEGVKIGPITDGNWSITGQKNNIVLNFSIYRYLHYDIEANARYAFKIIADGQTYLLGGILDKSVSGVIDLKTVLPESYFDGQTHSFQAQFNIEPSNNGNNNYLLLKKYIFSDSDGSVPYDLCEDFGNISNVAGSQEPPVQAALEDGSVRFGPLEDNNFTFYQLSQQRTVNFSRYRFFNYDITANSNYFIKLLIGSEQYEIISPTSMDNLGVTDLSEILPEKYFDGSTYNFDIQVALTQSFNENNNYIIADTFRFSESSDPPEPKKDVDGSVENIFVDYGGERTALKFDGDNSAVLTVPTAADEIGIYVFKTVQSAYAVVDGTKVGNDYIKHYFVRRLTGETTDFTVTVGSGAGKKLYKVKIIKEDTPVMKYIKSASLEFSGESRVIEFDGDYSAEITVGEDVASAELVITPENSGDTVTVRKFGREVSSKLGLYDGRNTYVITVGDKEHTLKINRGSADTEDKNGLLGFTVVSKGTFSNKGVAEYVEGMKIMADTCHKYGVPVTWIVQSTTVRNYPDLFTEWHELYGDEIAVLEPLTVDNLEREIELIKEVCPWAEIKMAEFSNQPSFSEEDWQKLKDLGITSTWGVCYMQSYTDGISSEGAPWGIYNADRQMSKIPADDESGITRVEWSSRDLNLAYRTSWPEYFSFVGFDSYTPNVILFDDIAYWINDIEQYRRNTEFNSLVPIIIEEEYDLLDPSNPILTKRNKDSTVESMEKLFEYIRDKEDFITNASDLVERYNSANNDITPSTYAFFDNIAPDTPLIAYRDVFGHRNAAEGQEIYGRPMTFPTKEILSYPDAFIYYDQNSMSFFDKGDPQPKRIYDYTKVTPENVNEHVLPRSEDKGSVTVEKVVTENGYRFDITVTAKEDIPYGVALWGDYLEYDISCDADVTVKKLGSEMVYVSMLASAGETSFSVTAAEKTAGYTKTGDVNGDGEINLLDLIRMKKTIAAGDYSQSADINSDKKTDALDIAEMRKYLLGTIKGF